MYPDERMTFGTFTLPIGRAELLVIAASRHELLSARIRGHARASGGASDIIHT